MKTLLLILATLTLAGCATSNLSLEQQARVDRFTGRVLDIAERAANAQLDRLDSKIVKPLQPPSP